MRFGFMEDFRNPPQWKRPSADLYAQLIKQVEHCEALGFDSVWLTEHHFTDDGYNPAPLTTAAAIAARTHTIRIGTFVLLLPFQNPLLVAEEVASIDILSRGRFDLGVGQGYAHHEFDTLRIPRSERGERMSEGIEVIKRLFTEERVSFDGKFTKLADARLSPRPIQQPHPPIWIGARGPKAISRAAALGHHLMATLGPDPAPRYHAALREFGRDPSEFKMAQLRMVYVAETEDQAWAECQDHLFHMLEFYQSILASANDAEGDDAPMPVARGSDLRSSPAAEVFMIGTPDQVRDKLRRFKADFLCTDFIVATQFPGLDPAKGTRALDMFAREVMPEFRNDPITG